jgi:phage gp29-like protein
MISGVTTYDNVRIVDAIVDEGEQGIFINSARLVDQVLRDARIYSTAMTRILGLLGKPLEFEPAEISDGRTKTTAERYAKECESEWPRMFEHSALVELLLWGIFHNSGLAQVIEDTDPWTIEVWHPWALTWDEYERRYYVQTREDARLYIESDGKGGYVDQNGTRWILYTPHGFGNTRRGLLRAIARLYLERAWAHRDRARYSEIHGQPMRLGIAPANATKEEVVEFKKRLSPIGAEPVIVARQGEDGNRWDAKLIEAMGKSAELFEGELSQLDREIATLLLGQSQTTDGQAGLGSNDQAGEPVRVDIMAADGDSLSDAARNQFLVPYYQFAYGSGDMAPWPCWRVAPPEDSAKKATEFKTVMDGLAVAKAQAIPVNEREMLECHGIPAVSEAEQAAMEAEKQKKDEQARQDALQPQNNPNQEQPSG